MRAACALTLLDKLIIQDTARRRSREQIQTPLRISSPLRLLVLEAAVAADLESLPPSLENINLSIPTTVRQREILPQVSTLALRRPLDDRLLSSCPNVRALTVELLGVSIFQSGPSRRLQTFPCVRDLRFGNCGLSAADVQTLCGMDLDRLTVIEEHQDPTVTASDMEGLEASVRASAIPHKRVKMPGFDFVTPNFPSQIKFST